MVDNKEEKIIKEQADQSKEVFIDHEKLPDRTELKESFKEQEPANQQVEHSKIREQIESMDLDDKVKLQAQDDANKLKSSVGQAKVDELLKIAQKKGVIFALHVAKKMDDPNVLDSFHDALAKEGYYKKFLK